MQMTAWLFSVLYLASLAGCSGEDFASMRGKAGSKKKVEDADLDADVVTDDEEHNRYTRRIDNSGANFQVKDLELLRSSINSCMGPDMLAISGEMFLPTNLAGAAPPPLADARIRFLLASQYNAGDDILVAERGNMVDQSSGVRTGIAADSLTDTYLRSLETVANVVAHNCTPDRPECQCGTQELARQMLIRCLPRLDPETKEMDEAAEMLGLVCSEGGPAGMRKAVASMLSSYAFAAAR